MKTVLGEINFSSTYENLFLPWRKFSDFFCSQLSLEHWKDSVHFRNDHSQFFSLTPRFPCFISENPLKFCKERLHIPCLTFLRTLIHHILLTAAIEYIFKYLLISPLIASVKDTFSIHTFIRIKTSMFLLL